MLVSSGTRGNTLEDKTKPTLLKLGGIQSGLNTPLQSHCYCSTLTTSLNDGISTIDMPDQALVFVCGGRAEGEKAFTLSPRTALPKATDKVWNGDGGNRTPVQKI